MKFLNAIACLGLLVCSNAFATSPETYQLQGFKSNGNYWTFKAMGNGSGLVDVLPGSKQAATYLQSLDSDKTYSCNMETYRAIANSQSVLMVFEIKDCQ